MVRNQKAKASFFSFMLVFLLGSCGGTTSTSDPGQAELPGSDVGPIIDTSESDPGVVQDFGTSADEGNQQELPAEDLPTVEDILVTDEASATDAPPQTDAYLADEGSVDVGSSPQDAPQTEDTTVLSDTEPTEDTVVAEDIAVCVPGCDDKFCGSDGCGGFCGLCPEGATCSLTGVCEIAGLSPFGGPCHITEDCQPTMIDALTGQEILNPVWPTCLNSQCEDLSAICLAPYGLPACAKTCNVSKDDIDNASGESTPDNIDDPDVVGDACEDAYQGVVEGEWSCVALSSSFHLCNPGVDFKPCDSNADCFGEESCQILNVGGGLEARCQPKLQEGFVQVAKIGELCEENPYSPSSFYFAEESFCESQLCFGNGVGCSGYCFNDNDCANFEPGEGCEEGTCAKKPELSCTTDADCSALSCENLLLSSNLGYADEVCFPKTCTVDSDCPDPDTFCRTFSNGQDGLLYGWEHRCLVRPDNTVGLGEICNDFPTEDNPGPICENPIWCLHGYCGTHCNDDDDCDLSKGQRCIVREFLPDTNNDGLPEKVALLGICGTYPHEGQPLSCTSDSDCSEPDSVCAPFLTNLVEANHVFESQCVNPGPYAPFGAQCGAENAGTCASKLCFNLTPPGGAQQPTCTSLCQTADDCGVIEFDGVSIPTLCTAIFMSNNGTFTGGDNIFFPVCVPTNPGSSLTDCSNESGESGDPALCPEGEFCLASPIATDLLTPNSIDFRCVTQPIGADASFDEDCFDGGECLTGYCLGATNLVPGQCAILCNPDLDEPCSPGNEDCDPLSLLVRSSPSESITTTFCIPGTSPPIEPPLEDVITPDDSNISSDDGGPTVDPGLPEPATDEGQATDDSEATPTD